MSRVMQLYQLQLVDSEWDEKDARLQFIADNLGESSELVRAREALVKIEEGLAKLRAQMRALELEIAGLNAKLKKNQDRLYSGRVRNPKELSNLQEEAAALGRRQAELEDEQLELMIAIEEAEAELAEQGARLRQIEGTWREDQAGLLAEKETVELDLVDLEERREMIRARIGAGDLALYDDMRPRMGGTAVASVKRGVCQACGVDVPTSMARSVERGEGMHHCPICNRLLCGGC